MAASHRDSDRRPGSARLVGLPELTPPIPRSSPDDGIGSIDTPRGQMEIALNLTLDEGQLTGVLETAHGEWKVTGITEEESVWTVSFESPDGSGSLTGRVKAAQFTGTWVSPMAKGTFQLQRAKKRS